MLRILLAAVLFSITFHFGTLLTSVVQLAQLDQFLNWLIDAVTKTAVGTANSPETLAKLIQAIIWAAILYFLLTRPLSAFLKTISPYSARFADTQPARTGAYYGTIVFLFLFPIFLYLVLANLSKNFVALFLYYFSAFKMNTALSSYEAALKEISTTSADVIAVYSLSFIIALYIEFIFLGILSVILCHILLFRASSKLERILAFIDFGRFGLGGSARFGNMIEDVAARLQAKGQTLFLGNSLFIPWLQIGQKDDRHMLTIAGSRSGKGTSSIVPNLLAWRGSVLCIDPKGNNYLITKRRREELGQKVYVIDPFHERSEHTECFNPLEELDPNSLTIVEDIGAIAEALIMDQEDGKNKHFTASARALVSGYIAHIITSPEYENPSLVDVYDIFSAPAEEQIDFRAAMMMNNAAGGLAKNAASRILDGLQGGSTEFQSVYVTAIEQLKWIGSLAMREVLAKSTCSFTELRKSPTSFYLIVPTKYLKLHSRFQRLIVNSAFGAFKKGGRSPIAGLFIIDEAHSLGHMREIEEGYGLDAGYNLTIWTFFQDKGQIDRLYKSVASSFFSSSRATQVFSVRDENTLKFVTQQLGKRSLGGSLSLVRKAETAPLRAEDEIAQEIGKTSGQAYILRGEKRPLLVKRVNYFESSQWAHWADPDPDYPNTKLPWLSRLKKSASAIALISVVGAFLTLLVTVLITLSIIGVKIAYDALFVIYIGRADYLILLLSAFSFALAYYSFKKYHYLFKSNIKLNFIKFATYFAITTASLIFIKKTEVLNIYDYFNDKPVYQKLAEKDIFKFFNEVIEKANSQRDVDGIIKKYSPYLLRTMKSLERDYFRSVNLGKKLDRYSTKIHEIRKKLGDNIKFRAVTIDQMISTSETFLYHVVYHKVESNEIRSNAEFNQILRESGADISIFHIHTALDNLRNNTPETYLNGLSVALFEIERRLGEKLEILDW